MAFDLQIMSRESISDPMVDVARCLRISRSLCVHVIWCGLAASNARSVIPCMPSAICHGWYTRGSSYACTLHRVVYVCTHTHTRLYCVPAIAMSICMSSCRYACMLCIYKHTLRNVLHLLWVWANNLHQQLRKLGWPRYWLMCCVVFRRQWTT